MSPRLLIVRLSAIGDTIHSLPLASALREIYPKAFLGWVVETLASPLIVGNPLLNWYKVLPRGWIKSPCKQLALKKELKNLKFDTAFDPQGLTKSSVAAWLSRAPKRIGFVRGEAREIAPFLDNILVSPPASHVVENTLSLITGLGLEAPTEAPLILPPCPKEDLYLLEGFFSQLGKGPYNLIAPFSNNLSKCWPLDRYAELARRLFERTGRPTLVLGHGEKERKEVLKLCQDRYYLVQAPELSILGVAELIKGAMVSIGSDSFPMHLASGLKLPCLVLFSVSDPKRVGPQHLQGISVYSRLTITHSSRARDKLSQDNMLALSVDTVEKAYDELQERLENSGA
ncbi:MAG: glycosyltransferase family 9 protein [Deltaproteobacteria bacterium]|jgi:ADP-heptose:LPS heptosyltransferase|nr:glycosyltransferase family 9 protein [Deltaproteobacteria bacterium]